MGYTHKALSAWHMEVLAVVDIGFFFFFDIFITFEI